jgi:hypothetical protein
MTPDHAEAYCRTPAESRFLTCIREAASHGVGYGWMQQVIEVEWQAQGVGAWGPASFEEEIRRLTAEVERLRHAPSAD